MEVRKVLLVEDSDIDQFIFEDVLKRKFPDVEIVLAFDGEEALDLLASSLSPDLIFLDINMPIMNGHEFLCEYNNLNYSNLVFMLSSSQLSADVESSLTYDFVKDYYTKPFSIDQFNKAALHWERQKIEKI